MTKKLWQKSWQLNPLVEAFETKDDLLLDQKLVKADVLGSLAQAEMLKKIGVLTPAELKRARRGLLQILKLNEAGKFNLEPGDEDVHTKIENFLTLNCGEVGKKIHTARSRNDQVLTALRIFSKEKILSIWRLSLELSECYLLFAKKHQFVPMPGYTHMQKAMPSTVGMWGAAFAESLLDDLEALEEVYELNDQSPLGSAAGYGVPLKIDREYTAKLLGFGKVQRNSLYCQNSRGKIEGLTVAALVALLQTINRFAGDVLLFTTAEFNYFEVAPELCSGSSIMPQKKNVDIAELLRSKVHLLTGFYVQLVGLSANLPSGYNRDLQDSKKPLIESLEITEVSLQMAVLLLQNLTPKKEVLEKALTPEIFAAHKAFRLVQEGVPFREAYHQAAGDFTLEEEATKKFLKMSLHAGGTGNLGLIKLKKEIASVRRDYTKAESQFFQVIKHLLG